MRSLLSVAALAAMAQLSCAAQSINSSSSSNASTVTIAMPSINPTAIFLSLVTTAPSTVFAVGCATSYSGGNSGSLVDSGCPYTYSPQAFITMTPGFFGYNMTNGPQESDQVGCSVSGGTFAICITTATLEVAQNSFSTQTASGSDPITLTSGAATITAGLPGQTTSSSTSATAGPSSSSSKAGAVRETGAMGLLAAAGVAGVGVGMLL